MLSVIVPAHNEASVLPATLTSICDHLTTSDELIVVCDSCHDNSADIALGFTNKVYSQTFGSAAQARNYGAAQASHNVLLFIDADTQFATDYFAHIKTGIAAGIDYGCAPLRSDSGHWLGQYIANGINRFNHSKQTFGGNCFVKRDLFEQIGGFNNALIKGEDTDLGERLHTLGARYGWLDSSHIVHNERKFQAHGYMRYYVKLWLGSVLWQCAPRLYQRLVGVKK